MSRTPWWKSGIEVIEAGSVNVTMLLASEALPVSLQLFAKAEASVKSSLNE
jgi:hypothetical protein